MCHLQLEFCWLFFLSSTVLLQNILFYFFFFFSSSFIYCEIGLLNHRKIARINGNRSHNSVMKFSVRHSWWKLIILFPIYLTLFFLTHGQNNDLITEFSEFLFVVSVSHLPILTEINPQRMKFWTIDCQSENYNWLHFQSYLTNLPQPILLILLLPLLNYLQIYVK